MRVELKKNLWRESPQFKKIRDKVVVASHVTNEFLSMIHMAYSHHLGVEITPDDINLIICYYLAQNVNKNIEHYRRHLGSKEFVEIRVIRPEGFDITEGDNALGVFTEFIAEIDARNSNSYLSMLTNDFTTTTPLTRLCSQVSLSYMVKEFYGLYCETMCGIPYVDIEGVTADWQKIKDNIQKFKIIAHPSIHKYISDCEQALDYFIAPIYSNGKCRDELRHFYHDGKCRSGHSNYSGLILKFFNEPWPDHEISEVPSGRIQYELKIGPQYHIKAAAINAGPVGAVQAEDGTLKMVYDYYFVSVMESLQFKRIEPGMKIIDVDFDQVYWTKDTYGQYQLDGQRLHEIPEIAVFVNNNVRDQGAIIYDGKIWMKYREYMVIYRRRITFKNGKIIIGEQEIAPSTFLMLPSIWTQFVTD